MASTEKTPEEKLLELIEDPSIAKRGRAHAGSGRFSLAQFKHFFSRAHIKDLVRISSLNRVALGVAAVATAWFLIDLGSYGMRFEQSLDAIHDDAQTMDVPVIDDSSAQSNADEAMKKAQARSMFSSAPDPKNAAGGVTDAVIAPDDEKAAFDALVFVGIAWSEERPQVMIEDPKANKTLILAKGETFGPFTVKEITPEKAVIAGTSNEWEMR